MASVTIRGVPRLFLLLVDFLQRLKGIASDIGKLPITMYERLNNSNDKLMHNLRLGSETAFDTIFYELYLSLCTYGFTITGDRVVAEDIAADAFIKVWERREIFQDFNRLKSYFYAIIRNEAINWFKAKKRRDVFESEGAAFVQIPEKLAWDGLVQAEVLRELYSGISKLPPQRQRVFKMLYQEGKSVKQVAEGLKVTTRAVRDHKREGLIFLRKIILPILIWIMPIN